MSTRNKSDTAQFTTRARVVDLLGREQIADAPTAMGEIFKNAMDAGAENVTVDYWPKQKCLIIGDDGLGMRTKEELLDKWLVLATDSKQQALDPKSSWLEFATQLQRETLIENKAFGKKGIGRLAIGLLGSGTLVWTRWGKGQKAQRTLMLVHWSVFRHPLLTLDDIKIPILTLYRKATIEDARSLVETALSWVKTSKAFDNKLPHHLKAVVTEELTNLFIKALQTPIDFPDNPGTQFIILNTDDMVSNHFEGWLGKKSFWGDDDLEDPEGPKAYLAFCNPFSDSKKPRLNIYLSESGQKMDLEKGNFWTKKDIGRADHSLKLEVNEEGFATGKIRRGNETHPFEWQIPRLPSRSKWPGSFSVQLGYVEGQSDLSKLPPEEFQQFQKRLSAFGGFYVYMDDVRVCPYGRDNEDFIEFEKRRSLNAGRHFFSHRRMFGAVILRQDSNKDLTEKAGREGFQQNAAYRGLVFSLKSLFLELADTYFGSKSEREDKAAKKAKTEREKRYQKQELARREFIKQLNLSKRLFPSVVDRFNVHAEEVANALNEAVKNKSRLSLDAVLEAQNELRANYNTLWDQMVISSLLDFDLHKDDLDALDGYLIKQSEFDAQAKKSLSAFADGIDKLAKLIEIRSSSKESGQKILAEARLRFERELIAATRPVMKAADGLKKSIEKKPSQDLSELDKEVAGLIDANSSEANKFSLAAIEESVATQNRFLQDKLLPFYEFARKQIEELITGDSLAYETADLREEIRIYRERELHLMELAQFGLVMETSDHDFHSMMGNAAKAVESIEIDCPPNLKAKVLTLKNYLQHLEERLQGLDPLVRRVKGRVTDIGGGEIRDFVQSAFEQHRREGITFEYTPKFHNAIFSGVKRAVLLGGVHNIVMNAGYWVSKNNDKGSIRFSIHPQGFVVSDSGPGVNVRDRERIFDPGFSRRPSGRGLGLYIARSCFRSFDYDLELLNAPANNALKGANFLIKKPSPLE